MTRPLALVTGGSAGIGLELARLLAKDGHDLVVTGASDRVASAAEELRQLGGEVIPVRSALSAEEGTAAVLDAVAAAGRPLDVAVLNAGIAVGGAFVDIPLERHLQLIALDVLSPVRMAHRLIPEMVADGGGKVLLVSSLSATTPTPYEEAEGNSVVAAGTLVPDELTGDVRYTVAFPILTTRGFEPPTPTLVYNAPSGDGPGGLGWSLELRAIGTCARSPRQDRPGSDEK